MTKKIFSTKNSKVIGFFLCLALVMGGLATYYVFTNTQQAEFSDVGQTSAATAAETPVNPSEAAMAEQMSGYTPSAQASGEEISADESATPLSLDIESMMAPRTLGKPDAPIKIVEYASLTCGHCAHFHTNILPELKEKYIDTGKVFFEFREFPLNDPALKATITARCLPAERYEAFISLLFKSQDQWASSADFMGVLRQNAKLAGLSDARFDACQNSQELKAKIADVMQQAQNQWKVESTPTFVINDGAETLSGAQPVAEFERVFRKLTNDEIGAAPQVQ